VAEWSIAAVSKTVEPLRVPGVRISPSPPDFRLIFTNGSAPLADSRPSRCFAVDELVSHPEQVPQHIGIDAGQANQHCVIVHVVVGEVINIGRRRKQLGAVFDSHTDDQRIRFRRAMSRHTREEFSLDLERRDSVRGALLDAWQGEPDTPHDLEVDGALAHGSAAQSLLVTIIEADSQDVCQTKRNARNPFLGALRFGSERFGLFLAWRLFRVLTAAVHCHGEQADKANTR
jgi:hypothetical protein